jgi:hypothetical protein
LPFIGVTSGRLLCVPMDMLLQRRAIGMVAHTQTTLPTLPAHGPDNGRAIIGIRAVATPLVGSAPRRIKRVAVFVSFFPPRSETSRRFLFGGLSRGALPTFDTRSFGVAFAKRERSAARAKVLRLRPENSPLCTRRARARRLGVGANYCPKRGYQDRG